LLLQHMHLALRSGNLIGRQGDNQMADKCFFCKGKLAQEKVNVDFRWGKDLIIIEDVPARVCRQCGEKYFDAEVYKEMERLAKGRIRPLKRLTIDVIKFDHPVLA